MMSVLLVMMFRMIPLPLPVCWIRPILFFTLQVLIAPKIRKSSRLVILGLPKASVATYRILVEKYLLSLHLQPKLFLETLMERVSEGLKRQFLPMGRIPARRPMFSAFRMCSVSGAVPTTIPVLLLFATMLLTVSLFR